MNASRVRSERHLLGSTAAKVVTTALFVSEQQAKGTSAFSNFRSAAVKMGVCANAISDGVLGGLSDVACMKNAHVECMGFR